MGADLLSRCRHVGHRGLRDLAPRPFFRGNRSYPVAPHLHGKGCVSGYRWCDWIAVRSPLRRGPDCPPTIVVPHGADPGGPPPGGPVPAPSLPSWRSAGSSPAGIAPRASTAPRTTLALPDLSQAACTSPGTPHDDAIPVDRATSSLRSRAAPRCASMILARDPDRLRRTFLEWPMNRVASAEAGRQPFPPLRAHDDAVRSTHRTLPEEVTAFAKRRVRTPKASPGLQRDRLEMSGSFWLGPRSNAPTSPRRDGCSR